MNSGLVNISSKTKISALIKANPLVIEALIAINPHFRKLRNPVLRKLLASRVNISDACKIADCKLTDFMNKMNEIGFKITETKEIQNVLESDIAETSHQDFFEDLSTLVLDVRPILAKHEDPLKFIVTTIDGLKKGQNFKLINTFEPLPLIRLLSKKGFTHYTERPEPEVVVTWFTKTDNTTPILDHLDNISLSSNREFDSVLNSYSSDLLETIDVRHLEMPLPMVTILQKLEELPIERALLVLHKKIPVYLLPELKERKFNYLIKEIAEKKVHLLIFKA